MRALVQRVESASVEVAGSVVGSCGRGLLVLLGVGPGDDRRVAERLWHKVRALRIFADEEGKTNRSLVDVGGGVLVVSHDDAFLARLDPSLVLELREGRLTELQLGGERAG